MIPRGRKITTSAISPPKTSSRALPPPRLLLDHSFSGSIRNAPSTGPNSVPRPPSNIESRIWTLSRMLNIPVGSMNAR